MGIERRVPKLSNESILISTVGRPTMAIKTRLQVIFKYGVSTVIGLIPKGNPDQNQVLKSIIDGWNNEKSLITQSSQTTILEHRIGLDFFYFQDARKRKEYSNVERDLEIFTLAKQIIEHIKKIEVKTIIFDISSGRRILSAICLTVARYLQDLGSYSDLKPEPTAINKLKNSKFIILTRPTPSHRLYVDVKQVESGEYPQIEIEEKANKIEAGIHELSFRPYPILNQKDAEILKRWEEAENQKELGSEIATEFDLKINSGEKIVSKFKNQILIRNQFIQANNSHKLSPSGTAFRDFYAILVDNGTSK